MKIVHLRKGFRDKGIGIVFTIKIRLDKVENAVVSESAPFDIDDNLER